MRLGPSKNEPTSMAISNGSRIVFLICLICLSTKEDQHGPGPVACSHTLVRSGTNKSRTLGLRSTSCCLVQTLLSRGMTDASQPACEREMDGGDFDVCTKDDLPFRSPVWPGQLLIGELVEFRTTQIVDSRNLLLSRSTNANSFGAQLQLVGGGFGGNTRTNTYWSSRRMWATCTAATSLRTSWAIELRTCDNFVTFVSPSARESSSRVR
jgi:hypothetical protein